jgi:Tat protein secretion system quality control protein TatD with DNase activity
MTLKIAQPNLHWNRLNLPGKQNDWFRWHWKKASLTMSTVFIHSPNDARKKASEIFDILNAD